MEIEEHIAIVEQEGKRFADESRASGLDSEVPPCPGWDVRDLVRHLGMIHLWAAGHIAFPHEEKGAETEAEEHEEFAGYWPELGIFWPEDDDLIDWYLRTNANLVSALKSAPEDLEAWTFLPAPSPRAMWARRQAHEISVHRWDAESAGAGGTGFDQVFADDGIDEILAGFAPRKQEFPVEEAHTMLVRTSDTGSQWHVTMAPDGISTSRGVGPADVTLSGSASDLYLAMWNRGDDSLITVEGDQAVFDIWHGNYHIRWS